MTAVALSGSRGGTTPHATFPSEQRDYLYRAAEVISVMNRGRAAQTLPLYYAKPEEIGPIDELQAATDKWDSLGPPVELASQHRALGETFHRMLKAYAPGAKQEAILEVDEPYNRWLEAVYEHYPLILVEGAAFMEPTFCRNDSIVFERSDGQIDRWQIVFLRRPLRNPAPSTPFYLVNGNGDVLRVAGLPGETIQVVSDGVLINGALDESYALSRAAEPFGPVTVPADHYFLLADDRFRAIDSRNNRIPGQPTFYSRGQIAGELPESAHGCEFNHPEPRSG